MNQEFEYPEVRMQKDLLFPVAKHFAGYDLEEAEGNELQNFFAVFYILANSGRVKKLRVNATCHLAFIHSGTLSMADIEQLPVASTYSGA